MDEVIIELALLALEKKLKSEIVRGKKTGKPDVVKEHEDKLFVLQQLIPDVKSCIGTPDPGIYDVKVNRYHIWPDNKQWSELSSEVQRLIEKDFQDRHNWFWEKIGELYDEYLELLVAAVSMRVEETGDGEKVLEKLQEILKGRMLKVGAEDRDVVAEYPDKKYWVGCILDALRAAAKNFYLKAPKSEDERDLQEKQLQCDQSTIWYDPEFVEPLRGFAFSRKWGKRFALLENGGSPVAILDEVWREIEELDLRGALFNALNCWDEEFQKAWAVDGGKGYTVADIFMLHEKLNKILRDYNAHKGAAMWMNGMPIEKMKAITLDEMKSSLALFQDLSKTRTEDSGVKQELVKGMPISNHIHWGVIEALVNAAEYYVDSEKNEIERLKDRVRFAEAEGTDVEHLSGKIVAAEQRVLEVEALQDVLLPDATEGQLMGFLTERVRAWLLIGLHGIIDFEKVGKWERDEALVRSEQRILDRGLLLPDKQFFMYKALELLRGLSSERRRDSAVASSVQGAQERCEWNPSDKELVEILCRIRETDWQAADYRANQALAKKPDGTVRYTAGAPFGEYGDYLWKRDNYPDIPPDYMLSARAWRMMLLPDVLNDIFSQKGPDADGCRLRLIKAIDDYRLAAKCKLLDVLKWERDRYKPENLEFDALERRIRSVRSTEKFGTEHLSDSPIMGQYIEFLGDSERDEYDVVYDEHLIERIIIAQRIKSLIVEHSNKGDNIENVMDNRIPVGAKKSRGAKRKAIDFIKNMITSNPDYSVLSEMRSGKNYKELKHSLWLAFHAEYDQYHKIEKTFKHDYVTDALNELFPERKQI